MSCFLSLTVFLTIGRKAISGRAPPLFRGSRSFLTTTATKRVALAPTSGQTVLYDSQGRLLFSGGITGSRGHSGDNAGRSSIVSLVNAGVADQKETIVFGCPLFNPNSKCRVSRK